jgi:hypothetical protein
MASSRTLASRAAHMRLFSPVDAPARMLKLTQQFFILFRFAHYECFAFLRELALRIRSVCNNPFSDFTQVTDFLVLNFPDNPNIWFVFSIRNLNRPWLVHKHQSLCTELCVFFLCCVSWQFYAVGRSGIEWSSLLVWDSVKHGQSSSTPQLDWNSLCRLWTPSPCHVSWWICGDSSPTRCPRWAAHRCILIYVPCSLYYCLHYYFHYVDYINYDSHNGDNGYNSK